MKTRIEKDSMGEVAVPADRYYGAQTQRSLDMFKIGREKFSPDFIHHFALVKKATALANQKLGLLDSDRARWITAACDEIIAGKWDDHFPLVVWQTGSGTQTHMNLNEVIAHRAIELATEKGQQNLKIDSHDAVNISQSTNDVFPTVMHVATVIAWQQQLIPAVRALRLEFEKKAESFKSIIKIGRTHMMDATPLTLGQELSGYAAQLQLIETVLVQAIQPVYELPIGGSAVGTGLNTHPKFTETVCAILHETLKEPFAPSKNRFALMAAHDPLVHAASALKLLATACLKIGGDIRLLASGPRAGFAELRLPANEPGSSIMPGKVNPTQIEALTMVALRVYGHELSISLASSQGQLELNVYKPLIIASLLESIEILSGAVESFRVNCIAGMTANEEQMRNFVDRSLMLVTALNPVIGYDNAAKIAQYAEAKGLTLKEAAVALKLLTAEEFDRHVRPEAMVAPTVS